MKKALIVIGVIVALLLVVALFLPSTVIVQRSLVINAPVEIVYDHVVDLEKYLKWSPWSAKDSSMQITWMDTRSGQGAGYSWEGNQMGKGSMVIEEAKVNEFIKNKLDFGMMGAGYGIWKFEPIAVEQPDGSLAMGNSVNVTWILESNLDTPIPLVGRYIGILMDFDKNVGPDFEQGLANLKEACESVRIEPDIEIETMDVMEVTMLSIKDSVGMMDLESRMGELYGEIVDFMNSKDIDIRAQPLCLYHEWNEEGGYTILEAGIPVLASLKVKPTGRIKRSTIPGGAVARVVHMGSYDEIGRVHYAIDEWIKANGKELRGGPWEVYITDPENEPDTSKWITEIYYPIK